MSKNIKLEDLLEFWPKLDDTIFNLANNQKKKKKKSFSLILPNFGRN